MHCIEARGLTKKFGSTLALNNVDLPTFGNPTIPASMMDQFCFVKCEL